MLDIEEVIQRLIAHKSSIGQQGTDGAADYDVVKGVARVTPFIHVIPTADSTEQLKDMALLPIESCAERFNVVLSVRNVKDSRGRASHAALKQFRKAVKLAIRGWTPTDMDMPIRRVSGRMMFMGNGLLQWGDVYETHYQERYELQN
jgi:hypothetical protein